MRLYETLNDQAKFAVDEAFLELAKKLKEHGYKLNMSDPAEKVVDAITNWVVGSN